MQQITWGDFEKVELRVGKIIEIDDLAGARKPAYILKIDFGAEIGVKQSSARITDHYSKEDLLGKLIVGVINFPPKRIAGFKSEVLVTGFTDADGKIVLISPDFDTPLGAKLM